MADKTLRIDTQEGKYGMIHTVSYRSDNEITIVNMEQTMNQIKQEDPKFYAFMQEKWKIAEGTTFSFGDKYFVPLVQDNSMLCVPLKVRNWDQKIKGSHSLGQTWSKIVRADELKLRKKMEQSGYFDVSNFVIQ